MSTYTLGEAVYTREQIEERAAEIGSQITRDYAGKDIILIGILTGCVMWMAEVMKSVGLNAAVDFMSVSSYGSDTRSSGAVKIVKDLSMGIEDRHVLVVEDIVDSGVTLDYLRGYLMGRCPASLKICTMLDKPARRRVKIDADYVGFTVPDVFWVGYGMDVNHRYRNLPYIAAVFEDKE